MLFNTREFVQIKELFRSSVERLKQASIPEPELETSLLLAHSFNIDRTKLLLAGEQTVDDDQLELFEKNISRRLCREPLAYITEEKEFWSLPFKVTRDVLIPRPETEFLVELALQASRAQDKSPEQAVEILDLGTGSGIIAIVLALELPTAIITAIDLSYGALQVAKYNARKHNVAARVQFVNSDWFGGISSRMQYDFILANPPYIARNIVEESCGEESGSLQPEVGKYEPRLALDGGERGIAAIARIAASLEKKLKAGGWFFMEIGADQAEDVTGIFQAAAVYDNITVHKDYAGLHRVFQARKI